MPKHSDVTTRRRVLAIGAATALAGAALGTAIAARGAEHSEHHPDADLLRLNDQLRAACDVECRVCEAAENMPAADADAAHAAASAACRAVVEQILAIRAVTFDGLKAKARAWWWANAYELNRDDPITAARGLSVDQEVTDSLLRDLLGEDVGARS